MLGPAKVKIYGERNSGTNYLTKLLHLNFEIKELPGTVPGYFKYFASDKIKDLYFGLSFPFNLGWKHALPDLKLPITNRSAKVIFLVKNPYSFLLSLHRRPYHRPEFKKLEFEEFIKVNWRPVGRARMKQKQKITPVGLWNLKTQRYLEYVRAHDHSSIIIRYEDLIKDPEQTLRLIGEKFKLEQKQGSFKNYEKAAKNKDSGTYQQYREYYLKEQWQNKLDENQVRLINERLNLELVKTMGYHTLSLNPAVT